MRQNGSFRTIFLLTGIAILIAILACFALGRVAVPAARASEPEQTYDIRSAEDFLAYARSYAAGDKNPKDVLNISITSGSTISGDGFISLGTAARPFAGTLVIPTAGIDTFYLADCPLFDYVSTDLTIAGSGVVKIMRGKANDAPAAGVLTSGSLFANHVVAGSSAASWNVSLSPYSGDGTASTSFACVLGDVAASASVTLSYTDTSALPVFATGNAGLICGTLGANATLTVATSGSGSSRNVTTSSGHAGGLVGEMGSGSSLVFTSGNNTRVTSVTTSSGYAGGIVGYANGAEIRFATGVTDYAVSGAVTGTTGAGGLFGYCKNTTASTFDMDKFSLASGTTVSSPGFTGGAFGALETTTAFTFDGNADGSEVYSVNLSAGSSRGGVIGKLTSSALTNAVTVTNVTATVNSPVAPAKTTVHAGGLVGEVSDNPAYLALSAVSVTSSGTLTGGLVGSVGSGGTFVDVSGSVSVSGTCDAGLVETMPHGVLRIRGVTDLGTFSQKDSGSGVIVKNRNRALIYALGTGANANWTLKRNLSNSTDDVLEWGQVLRVDGTLLTESDLFTVDMTAHTVAVKAAATTMNTLTQFALTALNVQLNTAAGVGALQFTAGDANRSATLLAGTLTLGADLSLADTGLLGLTRDDGKNAAFSGTFDGGGHTLTFATGKPYGLNASGAALASDSKQGNLFHHEYTGLFAKTNNATAEDLTLSGEIVVYQKSSEMKAGGFTAYATGSLSLSDVSADLAVTFTAADDLTYYFGGAVGYATNNGLALSFTDGTIRPTFTDATGSGITARTNATHVGGAIGAVAVGNNASPTQSVLFSGATVGLVYAKSINTARESVFGGAIAYVTNASYVKGRRTITFSDASLVNVTATGTTADRKFGGILGAYWLATDVTIDGLKVIASVTATGGAADFGGLVQTGTGGWRLEGPTSDSSITYTVPNNGSTFGFVANKASSTRSYYVNGSSNSGKTALYLSVDYASYGIGSLAFTAAPGFSAFDELVADSRFSTTPIADNGNAVISVDTSGDVITTDGSGYNTYLNKTAYGRSTGVVNGNTRYYYNLDYARTHTATAKYDFLVWSLRQYAHGSLSAWFVPTTSTFGGTLDMTGLSYYPVDLPSATVTFSGATLKLDNLTMEDAVKYAYRYDDNGLQTSAARTTLTAGTQHYLMHTSVFRNVTGTVNVTVSGGVGLTLQGNVPKLSDASCGFLISGTLGNSDSINAKVTAAELVFDGAYITVSGSHVTADAYAPLLINKIGKSSALTVTGAAQSTTAYSTYAANGYYAASSLIGDVGSDTARAIYLDFTGLVFDGRSSATSIGNMDTTYGTTKSVFKRAIILNSFLYFGECSGRYTFEIEDDWDDRTVPATAVHNVAYGKEITSSVENRNEQKQYNASEYYVHPTVYQSGSEYDFSTGFLPYVYVAYDPSDAELHEHELRVNISISTTIEGCGKYGDPFIIDDANKLMSIANIISTNSGSGVNLYLPHNIESVFDWTSPEYDGNTGYHKYLYAYGSPCTSSGNPDLDADTVRRYLAGAYYVVTRDLTLPSGFVGLGSNLVATGETDGDNAPYAFRGVVIGRGNPTITNQSTSPLIHTAMGCVVQNLTVDVAVNHESSDQISLAAPLGSGEYKYRGGNQSYGALIGQILGGDNFIDSVQITFSDVSFNLTATNSNYYVRLIPIGGYVGVLVNGGLIFRNMTSANVGLTSSVYDKVANSGYLYVNPIIGRVIAGYAFHETNAYHATEATATLKNGEKNYTICDLSLSEGKLNVARTSGTFTITVPDGQALFVLGAIVNSGSSSASYHASDEQAYDALTDFWSAYRAYTTARAGATYANVGTNGFLSASDYTDYAVYDSFTATLVKIPYIVRAYTNKTGSVYLARCASSSNANVIQFTGDCDVAEGFRGIGSIYVSSDLAHLGISQCTGRIGATSSSYTLTFHMRFLEYNHKSVSKYIAYAASGSSDSSAGFGLFTRLAMSSPSSSNSISYLTLAGSIFYDVYTIDGAVVTYAFANYRNSSGYDRTEAGNISGGNTENAVLRRTLLSVGGIAGFAKTQFYIKNVTFNDLYVEGAKTAGGLIGFAFWGTNNTSYITYESGITNAGFVNVVGGLQAGGLIGRMFRAAVQVDGATGGTDLIVRNVESKNADPDESNLYYFANVSTGVGGIVGTCWAIDKNDAGEKPRNNDNVEIANSTTMRRLHISNINVVKGANAANVRVLNDSGTKNNYAGGFVGSAHNVWLKISSCKLVNVNVTANTAGGFVGKMTQKYYLHIKNCSVEGTLTGGGDRQYAISGTRYAGGAAGWTLGRDTLYFQLLNFTITNYIVESTGTAEAPAGAGGMLGYAQGNNKTTKDTSNYICEFNNLTVLNCLIKTNYTNKTNNYLKYKCGTGGLIGVIDTISVNDGNSPDESSRGENNKYKFSGYNILIKDTTLTHWNGGSALSDDSFAFNGASSANRRIGDLVGNNAVQTPLWFVGVAVQNATYCGKHVGFYNSDLNNYGSGYYASTSDSVTAGYVVFANYRESVSNTAFTTSIGDTTSDAAATDAYAYVDGGVASYPYVTANPAFTFGGVTLTGDGVANSVANLAIQSIITDGATSTAKYSYAAAAYYSGNSGENNLTAFSSHYASKLVMFTTEVSGYIGTDFPVLLLDDTNPANASKMINSYLRLLTNTTYDFGTDLTNVFSIYLYKMSYADGVFTPTLTGVSLKRADGVFYMTNNLFDSGKLQFSLIDLRFFDPADTTKTAYRLFVPVFVKKVLSYRFDIAVAGGTDYHADDYTDKYGEALIENVGSPVTFYFSYTYMRTAAEWQSAINLGENVHRYYEKRLQFYKANTNDILKAFPADTVLVLVDPNRGGRAYYSTIRTALSGNTLLLSAFRTGFSRSVGVTTLSGDAFTPMLLEDLFTLSVSTVGGGSDTMVACVDGEATVFVSGQGYRLATDEELSDGSVTKYTVAVAFAGGATYQSETYYLSLFTESSVVNDALFHYYLVTAPGSFSESEYPSRITDTGAHTMVHLIMGKIFSHSDFTLSSRTASGTIMTSENNALTVDMSVRVGLSDDLDADIKANLQDLIDDTEVYQSFLVYLNRKEGNFLAKAIVGSPTGTGTYNVDYVLNGNADTAAVAYTSGSVRVTQNYAEFVSADISSYLATGNKFEINAAVTLAYADSAITSQFPGRSTASPDSGVTVSGSSNIAFSLQATTYSKNELSRDESPATSYYSEAIPEVAVLDLNAIGDKVGEFTDLGINALNNGNASYSAFELLAVIDVTAVYEQISGYDDAVLTVSLAQKQSDGSYGAALDISQYMTMTLQGVSPDPVTDADTAYTAVIDRTEVTDNGAEIALPRLVFSVKTGAALEASSLVYGNYRVDVSVVLRDDEGDEYAVSRVSNFIVYTNAKVLPGYIG